MIWFDPWPCQPIRSSCFFLSLVLPALLDTLFAWDLDQEMNDLRSTYIKKKSQILGNYSILNVEIDVCVSICVCACCMCFERMSSCCRTNLLTTAMICRLHAVMTRSPSPPLRYRYWLCVAVSVLPPSSFYDWQQNRKLDAQQTQTFKRNDLLGRLSFNLKDWSMWGGGGWVTWSIASRPYSCTQW